MNKEIIAAEVEERFQKELQFDKKYRNPPKNFNNFPAEIKYNETAILRENLILVKKLLII